MMTDNEARLIEMLAEHEPARLVARACALRVQEHTLPTDVESLTYAYDELASAEGSIVVVVADRPRNVVHFVACRTEAEAMGIRDALEKKVSGRD